MKTNNLQAMIAINANRITDIHVAIDHLKSYARHYNIIGEKAFAIDCYQQVSQQQRKLTKAVALQNDLKADVAYNERIERIIVKLVATGADLSGLNLTSQETEAALDKLLSEQETLPTNAE